MPRSILGWLAIVAGLVACRPEPVPAPEECLRVEESWERTMCLLPWFRELTDERSARYAVCRAARMQADGTIDDCHLVAHAIGEANLERYDQDPGRAFATCGTACIEGCRHGVMEAFIGALPSDVEVITAKVAGVCDDIMRTDRYACIHGLGHGLRHLGFLSLADAIAVCENAGDVEFAAICIGGVLMEQVDIFLPMMLEGLGDVLPQICSELEDDPRLHDCAMAIGEGLMFRTGHDLSRSHDLCLRLADPELIADCQHGADTEADVHAGSDDDAC
jgi:hypothetical protein